MHRIVALQGASNREIQTTMWSCVRRWRQAGARIVGAVEIVRDEGRRGPTSAWLADLSTGRSYPLFQDLGPGSVSCHLDGAGVSMACEAILGAMRAPCDLVVLSKFGKLEAGRSGLMAAFWAAMERDLPILTAVAPTWAAQWSAFAGPLARFIAPSAAELDRWWRDASERNARANERGRTVRAPQRVG